MQTIFFGSSSYVLPIIEVLNKDFALQLVVTTEQKSTDAVPKYCSEHNIPFVSIKSFRDKQWQNHWKLEIGNWKLPLAVLADFGLIIPQELIESFPKGIVNIHPSFLPYYRGTTPIQTAIKNGDTETAVSIMLLDKEVDHGPLLSQIPLPISPEDTSESLYIKAFTIGAETLKDVLPAYINGNLEPRQQDHSKATYTKPLTRESGFFPIDTPPTNLTQLIRAYYPWPGVWTIFRSKNLEVRIKLLPNNKVQVEGKKPVEYKDFINGYSWGKEFLEKLHLI